MATKYKSNSVVTGLIIASSLTGSLAIGNYLDFRDVSKQVRTELKASNPDTSAVKGEIEDMVIRHTASQDTTFIRREVERVYKQLQDENQN